MGQLPLGTSVEVEAIFQLRLAAGQIPLALLIVVISGREAQQSAAFAAAVLMNSRSR